MNPFLRALAALALVRAGGFGHSALTANAMEMTSLSRLFKSQRFSKRSRLRYNVSNSWLLTERKRPFDLDELIEEVYVGPRAPVFIFSAAKAVMDRFGLNKSLQRSSLVVGPSKAGSASKS